MSGYDNTGRAVPRLEFTPGCLSFNEFVLTGVSRERDAGISIN